MYIVDVHPLVVLLITSPLIDSLVSFLEKNRKFPIIHCDLASLAMCTPLYHVYQVDLCLNIAVITCIFCYRVSLAFY